ncbi:MAG: NAD-dependent epimerase/dehydratase family protein [Microthrixaceae bacterium]
MRVLVTGGTGFLGGHTAAALVRNGHQVRVLARDGAKVAPSMAAHGITAEVAEGDMCDAAAVADAVAGCGAVVHTAAEIAVGRRTDHTDDANARGTRTVLDAALAAGCDPVVYAGSIMVHFPAEQSPVTVDSPMPEPISAYGASKRAAELVVRAAQDAGSPVISFSLGALYGPTSPHLEGSYAAVLGALDAFMLVPPGGIGLIDVRDAANLLARAVQPGTGPHRFMAGGRFVTWADWTALLGRAVGREVPHQRVSTEDLLAMGRSFDEQAAEGGGQAVLSEEAAQVMTCGAPTDDSGTQAAFGMAYRPLAQTFADTVAYLRDLGRLAPERAESPANDGGDP